MTTDKELTKSFRWMDRNGHEHEPSDMDTRHLFFTIRMIWNHVAPRGMRIHPFKRYTFPEYYTKDYICRALTCLFDELNKRKDMDPYFIDCLERMKKHVIKDYHVWLLQKDQSSRQQQK